MALSDDRIKELLAKQKTRWERMEEWLFDHEIHRFTVYDVAAGFGCPVHEATALVQAYLAAQRREQSGTLFVLKREGRTRSAVWSVGQRTVDARVIGGTLFEDVEVKVRRAFAPDMARLAAKNPRAAKYCEAKIDAVMNGALVVLKSAVDSYMAESE
jgi:hypothetical protein